MEIKTLLSILSNGGGDSFTTPLMFDVAMSNLGDVISKQEQLLVSDFSSFLQPKKPLRLHQLELNVSFMLHACLTIVPPTQFGRAPLLLVGLASVSVFHRIQVVTLMCD